MKRFTLLLFILIPVLSLAQEQQNNFGIKFSGYVKNDFFYDSRKTVGIREGHFYLYPENIRYDADSNDINAKTTFNILSIQTRLRGDIFGLMLSAQKRRELLKENFMAPRMPVLIVFA